MPNDRRSFLGQSVAMGLMPFIPKNMKFDEKDLQNMSLNEIPKGRNKVGFNLLLWTASISDKMNAVSEKLKNMGYDGVEVSMGELQPQPYLDFGKHLKSIDMEVTSIYAGGKEDDPINESPIVRQKALDKLKWVIDRSNDMGSHLICGPVHSAFGYFRKRPPTTEEYKWSAEVLYKAGEYAAKANTIFAVEALNRFECYLCNTVSQLSTLIQMTDHPNIKPMYDTHHANIEEKKNTEAISSLKGKLAHVHISENDRGTPGDGHINWNDIFSSLAKINYNGWLTIESFSRGDPSFSDAINVWREFSPTWDVPVNGLKLIRSMQNKYNL